MRGWIWALAWRNLARHPRRVAITGATAVIGLFLFVLTRGWVAGIDRSFEDAIVATGFGHVKVYGRGFVAEADPDPVEFAFDDSAVLAERLRAVPGVVEAGERIVSTAEIGNGVDSLMATVWGVEPAREALMFVVASRTEGAFLAPAGEHEAIVGADLARLLQLKVGSDVTINTRTRAGAINAIDARVVGLLRSGNPMLDSNVVMISLAEARRLLDMPRAATELVALAADREAAEAVAAAGWAALGTPLDWRTWREETEPIREVNDFRRRSLGVIVGVLLLMAVAAIANTIVIAAYERTREVGMMMALGVTGRQVAALFVTEALLIGLVGGLIGAGAGGALVAYLGVHGVDLSRLTSQSSAQGATVPMVSTLYAQFSWADVLQAVAIGVAAAGLAGYLPARRLAGQDPVVALRQD